MKSKKNIKVVCGIVAVILFTVLLMSGTFWHVARYKITDIGSSTSNDSRYEVILQNVGEPDWPFGCSHAKIVLKKNGETVTKYKFDVLNDGGTLSSEQWQVTWKNDCAEVVISGEEQKDMLYILYFDGRTEVKPTETKSAENNDLKNAEEKSLQIVSLFKDIYLSAEKTDSELYLNQPVISQTVVDKIEDLLKDKGYSVMNSSEKYPAYLENADSFFRFWESVSSGEDAQQDLITVSVTGEMYYTSLHFSNGQKYRTFTSVGWDENSNPKVTSSMLYDIHDWELINENEFYYQVAYPPQMSMDDYNLVRLKPVDEKLFDLTEKYIAPIGYLNNNMFVCEWNSEDFGDLSFNDLLEYLYRMKNNEFLNPDRFEEADNPYFCRYIPKSIFENAVKPYFNVSLDEFRRRSLYVSEKEAYPWQEISCNNMIFYPSVEPEVIKYTENKDGTFTLTINARCNDYKTDRLFTHDVVIRPLSDGGYEYLSNKIAFKSSHELPPNFPRLELQRSDKRIEDYY